MRTSDNQYAVILKDHGIEFPGVIGDSDGNPLVLDETHIVSVITCEEEVIIIVVGGVHVNVPSDLVTCVGREGNVPFGCGAKDDDAFLAMLESVPERPELAAHILDESANELELSVLLAKAIRSDDRLKVTVHSLIRRLAQTEIAAAEMSDENTRLLLLDHVSRLKHSSVIVDEAKMLYDLGCFFRDRAGDVQGDVMADDSTAKDFFELSALAGNADAQNCLGARYHEGKGVERNMEIAFVWYMEAAKQGHAKALYNLGLCFEKGMGCEIDKQTAMKCYAESLEKSYQPAQDALNRLSLASQPVNKVDMRGSDASRSRIDWKDVAAGGAAFLGGVAIAAIETLVSRERDKTSRRGSYK